MPTDVENNQQDPNAEANAAAALQPVKQKTAVGKILQGIAHVVEAPVVFAGKELSALAKLFANSEPKVQADLKDVSQLVQTIKTEVNENPVVVAYLLRKINPAWTDDVINQVLVKAANAANIAIEVTQPTLVDTIAAIQAHASQIVPGTVEHSALFTTLFNVVGTLLSPGTPWGKVVSLGVYIYNTFIKPKA